MKKLLILLFTIVFILVSLVNTNATNLVYNTSFENATTNARGWYLNLDPDPQYGVPLSNYINGDGHQWIEGNESRPSGATFPSNFLGPHSGNRCLGLYFLNGSTSADRSNIALWTNPWAGTENENPSQPQPDLTGNEFYISEWLFLPDFVLGSTQDQWYGLFQYSNILGNAFPYYQFEILGHTGHSSLVPEGTLAAVLDWRDESGLQHYYQPYQNFQNVLPIGRWFNLEWYTLRDATNGTIKVWVDGVKIFDMSELNTKHVTPPDYPEPKGEPYSLDVARIYMGKDSNPHWLFVDDIEIWNGIPTQEESVTLSGRLVNKSGDSVQANISVDSIKNNTDSNGNYSLSVPRGVYDINYSIQNLWIKLISFNLTSSIIDLINHITSYTSTNKVAFTVNITNNQEIQVYSEQVPTAVKINGTEITNVSSLQNLVNNTWLYNASEKKVYMNVSSEEASSPPTADYYVIGSGGTYTAMNSSGQTIMTDTNAATVINYVLSRMTSGQKIAFSGDFMVDSKITVNVARITMNFSQATMTSATNAYLLEIRGSNITVFGGHFIGGNNPSSATDTGIAVFSTYDTIDRVEIRGFGYNVLGATAILPGWGSGYLTIKNCILHDNAQHINFEQSGIGHNKVQNCTFYNSNHSPIFISANTPYNEITNCEFYNWSQHGLYITGSEDGSLAPGGNIISGCNFHDSPNGDAISIKGKNNTFYNNRFTDVYWGFSIHSQYVNAEANYNEIYNNVFTRVFGRGAITFANKDAVSPTIGNMIHNNDFIDCTNAIAVMHENTATDAAVIRDVKIYYNNFVNCTNEFPMLSGVPSKVLNTVIAYNTFSKNVTNLAVETCVNTMVTGNAPWMEDFSPVYDPSSPYYIPPP